MQSHQSESDGSIGSIQLTTRDAHTIGDANGLGSIRGEEYHKSYTALRNQQQDNITASWYPKIISQEIKYYVYDIDTMNFLSDLFVFINLNIPLGLNV